MKRDISNRCRAENATLTSHEKITHVLRTISRDIRKKDTPLNNWYLDYSIATGRVLLSATLVVDNQNKIAVISNYTQR